MLIAFQNELQAHVAKKKVQQDELLYLLHAARREHGSMYYGESDGWVFRAPAKMFPAPETRESLQSMPKW